MDASDDGLGNLTCTSTRQHSTADELEHEDCNVKETYQK
jgi:hypothetical protein